ncbi:MAG: carboxypeptidase-like regulatory domain-containing protein [Fidelibacterota bacterium]|nr:MAG: carboxypeptidase-like regulatory domain-containing protein [Candidatus Neomarinimicrobiota bacterium]
MNNKTSYSLIRFLIPIGALLWGVAAHGQTTSKITGVVTDLLSRQPLYGVNVLVGGTYLGAATDPDGYFHILNVPVGVYEIEASMIGYKRTNVIDVVVSIDQVTRVDIEMEETALEGEAIVVVAERDILHKEISNSQQVVSATQLAEAPAVHTINQFLGSLAGVTGERRITVRGGSAEQTGTIVNGMSFVNQRIGKAEATIPLSAVEQISLQTGGFSAEYGNFRSGILNVTTKTGSKDAYHGTFSYSRNIPHMKRFGKSLWDPTNNGLRPYLDPVVSFMGTNTGWLYVTDNDTAEAEYLRQGHQSFDGWINETPRFNRGKPVEEHATPMDLYLWSAWMHQTIPDFERLEELYPQYEITEEQKQALRDHAHEKEGLHEDFDIDFGFGGPVPFLSEALGDATFYLSNKTTNFNYVQPVMRNGEYSSITMLTLKSNLTKKTTLKLNGLYRIIKGTQTTFPTDGTIPDLEGGGDTMPINNLNVFVDEVPHLSIDKYIYYWHPTFWQPKEQTTLLGGLTLDRMINPETFWHLSISYAWHQDFFEPEESRDRTAIINFGPVWVNEMPYGVVFRPDTVFYDPDDRSKYYLHDRYEAPPGMNRRFSSKVGEYHENSVTQQFRIKYDFSSQVNRVNLIKAGLELNYFDIDNDNWRWWEGEDTIYELRDRRKPWQLGGYIQDQISLEGMEARLGVRFDHYNSGGGVWPSSEHMWNETAFTKGIEGNNRIQLKQDLESGKHIVWDRWHAIDDSLGGTFLEKTKNFNTISPRVGIAFPITERSKFFFNYGHFRSLIPYSEQFMYKMRFYKRGLFELGNPNLEPPRTISYELGVAYNLLDQYLIQASTYYKDVTGEASDLEFKNILGTLDYDGYLGNRWENDQGFELRITKNQGAFLTGWFNFWFVIDKNGSTGRESAYEDSVRNATAGAFYAGEENSPTLIPRVSANVSFHTPKNWGPQFFGIDWLGGWMISVLPEWRQGNLFTHNPADIRNLSNNLRWPDYYMVDFKMSKTVAVGGTHLDLYVDVHNILNLKVSQMDEEWAFRTETDKDNYLNSLRLDIYDSDEYDSMRDKNPGMFIPGNDKVGELRSEKKPYINDPDNMMFLYDLPRDIWFGLKISF